MARELAVKTKNAIKRSIPDAIFSVKNVRVNGRKLGCNGFVTNPSTGKTVFIETDVIPLNNSCYYYRDAPVAGVHRDHGANIWCKTFDEFTTGICKAIA